MSATDIIKELSETNGKSHAIVIGGSMAGLLAARVLVDHFDRVTIIERDMLPPEPAPRKGVPQGRHVHVLLARGRLIIEQLFPGILEQLAQVCGPIVDMADDVPWFTPAGWGVRFNSGIGVLPVSRDVLELQVRHRVWQLPRVRFIEGCDVRGLISNQAGDRITGVRVGLRAGVHPDAAGLAQLQADLVVDASGRGSKAPRWLADLGYTPPGVTVINAFLGYASRIYRRPAAPRDWSGIYIQAAPPTHSRGGVLFPIEGDRWLLTVVGLGRDYPPTDEAGFLEFARSLRVPAIYDAIKDAEPLSDIYSYRATENNLRHYERMSRRPEGFIVLGDAACAFNPVYGQGMTTAALSAQTLSECLNRHRDRGREMDMTGLAARFQKKLAKANTAAWMLATGEDLRVPQVVGKKPGLADRLMQRYVDRVVELSTENEQARLLLLEVFNLLKPPTALFHPTIFAQLLKRGFRSQDSGAIRKESGFRIQNTAPGVTES